jgi:hypothetical protein
MTLRSLARFFVRARIFERILRMLGHIPGETKALLESPSLAGRRLERSPLDPRISWIEL